MTGKPERQTAETLMYLKNNRWEAKMCNPYPTDTLLVLQSDVSIHSPANTLPENVGFFELVTAPNSQ